MFKNLQKVLRNEFSLLTKVFFSIFFIHYGSVIFLGEINSVNKITFGLYVLFIFYILLKHFFDRKLQISNTLLQLIIWSSITFILYSFFLNKTQMNFGWFIGDFLVFYSIIFSMLLGHFVYPSIFSEDTFEKIMIFLFVILIFDFIYSISLTEEAKIRSISRLIIVPSFFIFKFFKERENKYLYLTIACFIMAIISNMRYAFVIMILMIIFYSIFFYKSKIFNFINLKNSIAFIFSSLVLLFILYENNILQLWSFYYLFSPAFQGELGIVNVFLGRIYEVQDAYNQYLSQFNLGSLFFGNGFGASYQPNEFMRFFVKDFSSEGAIYENLRRHIIHFGPARFFFRYGLIGLLIIMYIFYKNILMLYKIFKNNSFGVDLFFSLTLFLYLLRFFLQPIFNDIMILFCLTGFFIFIKTQNVKVEGA